MTTTDSTEKENDADIDALYNLVQQLKSDTRFILKVAEGNFYIFDSYISEVFEIADDLRLLIPANDNDSKSYKSTQGIWRKKPSDI